MSQANFSRWLRFYYLDLVAKVIISVLRDPYGQMKIRLLKILESHFTKKKSFIFLWSVSKQTDEEEIYMVPILFC
jgi:hypothetical protein